MVFRILQPLGLLCSTSCESILKSITGISSGFCNYPSGYPFPYSAELLRAELDRVSKTYPDRKKIILIGHSMGELVARLLVTDTNLVLWNDYFGGPLRRFH